MRRFSMVIAAALATAMIVVAVTALDAIGADGRTAKPEQDLTAKIAQCLRGHGVAVPQLTGVQLERWLATHEPPLATARACKQAVAVSAGGDLRKPADSADVKNLTDCLRAHGAQPPSAPADLKRWILRHQSDPAVAKALKECGMGPPSSCGDKEGQGAAPVGGAKDGAA